MKILLLVFILAFIISCNKQKKSITDFSADNYYDVLKPTDKYSIFSFSNNVIQEMEIIPRFKNLVILTNNPDYLIEKDTTFNIIKIWNKYSGIEYSVKYNEKTALPYWCFLVCLGQKYEVYRKHVLQGLLSTGQFIVKESELKKGTDILVNEQPEFFIVVKLNGTIKDAFSFEFTCYDR